MFVAAADLEREVRRICEGSNLRIAAAFVGAGFGSDFLRGRTGDARIICDLTMGGTNPRALIELGAPDNVNLQHLDRLHAKIYICDAGCVVASANASENGLGLRGRPARLREAGVRFNAGSLEFDDASRWFEELWAMARQVDAEALVEAARAWRQVANARALLAKQYVPEPITLPELLKREPNVFGEIMFFFTVDDVKESDVEAAVKAAERQYNDEFAQRLRKMEAFSNWLDSTNVPPLFFNIHREPNGACWATLCSRGHHDEKRHVYFASRCALTDPLFSDLNERLKLDRPTREGKYRLGKNAFSDVEVKAAGYDFLSAEELSERLLATRSPQV